jgi:nicotinic acid mononucleotide adenylyltransferase
MKFTYKSINYTVRSLNGFPIHNDTKFVLVVGNDGSRKVSEWNKVKPFIFDIYRLNKTQHNQKE